MTQRDLARTRGCNMYKVTFPNYYKAKTERDYNPFHRRDDVIVKTGGGYMLLSLWDYHVWKKQK